jgi:hypothetical protein
METALDCAGMQLAACVVLDGCRFYEYAAPALQRCLSRALPRMQE